MQTLTSLGPPQNTNTQKILISHTSSSESRSGGCTQKHDSAEFLKRRLMRDIPMLGTSRPVAGYRSNEFISPGESGFCERVLSTIACEAKDKNSSAIHHVVRMMPKSGQCRATADRIIAASIIHGMGPPKIAWEFQKLIALLFFDLVGPISGQSFLRFGLSEAVSGADSNFFSTSNRRSQRSSNWTASAGPHRQYSSDLNHCFTFVKCTSVSLKIPTCQRIGTLRQMD
jgi:hypothetical protein